MNEFDNLLKVCGCGSKPYIVTPPGITKNGFEKRTKFYAYAKCICGIKTETVWASNQVSANYKAIGIWNKAMKTTISGGSSK